MMYDPNVDPMPVDPPEDLPLIALPGLRRYSKAITAFVLALIGWGTMVVTSDPAAITSAEWIMLGSTVVTAGGVFSIPNTQPPVPPAD
jgi:hypothetical protein